ncbi:MAG: bifunctional UDP-sugar hydrolase/5'-nucleotidase [Pseudomonadota bacterium]
MSFRFATLVILLLAFTLPARAEYTLHVIHINDLHSRIEPVSKYDSTCSAQDDAAGKCFGGVARVASKIKALRDQLKAEGKNVIVLDAGDQFQGSLMYTTYKGAAEAEFMEAIGFDAMAVGNHEFDDGPEALAAFIDKVSFPVVSGNLDLQRSNVLKDKVKDHIVLDVGGEKIGIVSALAADTDETSSPGPTVGFEDEIESLRADVASLGAQGVNKIIALTHVGLRKDIAIGKAVEGLDAIVGGHSHSLLSNTHKRAAGPYPLMAGTTPVVQAYAYSKYVGVLKLTFDKNGRVVSAEGDTHLLDASVKPDPAIAQRIAELAGPIEELKAKVVGHSAEAITGARDVCRRMECAMGNLVADAMLERVKGQGVTIALQNSGGLRASIDAGPITMGEVLTVLPFQNTLSTFQITGAQIRAALENGVSQVEGVKGRFPQVAGLKFTWNSSVEPGQGRVKDVFVQEAGAWVPLDEAKVYGVVTNNYVRNGGDGYKMFATDAANAYDYGPGIEEVVAEYLIKHGEYTPYVDGRITGK